MSPNSRGVRQKKNSRVKHAGGRPTLYRPEYCESVVEFCGLGYSLTAYAGSLRVARDTIYEWAQEHQEFSDAVKKARAARIMSLEAGLMSSGVAGRNPTAYIFALKNASPEEWRDVQKQEISGPGDGPIRMQSVPLLTDEDLLRIAAQAS